VSDLVSSAIVLVAVLIGFAIAYVRYGSKAALADAPARLARESSAMPPVLVRGFFVDDLIGALIVRPAQALGTAFGRFVDPLVIDGAVRDTALLAGVLGLFTRALQTGLVRGYAIVIVVGVACALAYYAFAGVVR
jgi:NADH:ubiquinone oxidoreductase subunit 5 (subunit L)/multisubunit Na+/H+ antiporter MnhA subunit